jgi:flagellar FliL protein
MAENEAERKGGPAAPAGKSAPEDRRAAVTPQGGTSPEKEDAKTPATATKAAPQRLMAAVLLLGMVVGSASAAVVVASIVLRVGRAPAAAAQDAEGPAADTADKSGRKAEKTFEFTLENPLIVNVYETQERRYLSVKPVLVLDSAAALEKVRANQSELQHLLIGMLKGKTLEQLDDPDAANVIGREVQETANLKLKLDHAITRVYFTQFVVQ